LRSNQPVLFFTGISRTAVSRLAGDAFRSATASFGPDGELAAQFGAAAGGAGGVAGFNCAFWKHDRQSTGLPCVGLKGTVVDSPHTEHVVRVSDRTLPPLARFALHCLQCLGSFLNCLSWKKSCSPAVNMNSAPQSLHLRTRSLNSMAGFPEERKCRNRP